MRYSVFTVVVLCLLLAGISSVVSQRGRGRLRAGRPSRTIGCRYAGYRSCCKRGSCFVPRGNCYCDVKCHLFRDCCFDIFKISCGEMAILYIFFVIQFQLLFWGVCVCTSDFGAYTIVTVCADQWNIKPHLIHACRWLHCQRLSSSGWLLQEKVAALLFA